MNNLSLLYIDNNNEAREKYTYIFKQYFTTVHTAKNAIEALKLCYTLNPDVLFLDISLSYLNGLKIVNIIHAEDNHIPIVIMSENTDREMLISIINLNIDGFLLKPIEKNSLDTIIHTIKKKMIKNDIIKLQYNLIWDKQYLQLTHYNRYIYLTKREHKILAILLKNMNQHISLDTLLLKINTDSSTITKPNVQNIVKIISRFNLKIQKKLKINTNLIHNTSKLGYKILLV